VTQTRIQSSFTVRDSFTHSCVVGDSFSWSRVSRCVPHSCIVRDSDTHSCIVHESFTGAHYPFSSVIKLGVRHPRKKERKKERKKFTRSCVVGDSFSSGWSRVSRCATHSCIVRDSFMCSGNG